MQVWPVAAKTPAMMPLAAAGRSASSKTTCGDLPPSSRVTRLRLSAAACATARPVAVDPVNATLSTPWCPASAAPSSRLEPATTLNTPSGKPGLVQHLGERERRRGGVLRRLDDERAAGRQPGGELEGHQQQRGVPRGDRADDADRLAAGVDEVVGLVGRDDPALDLVGVPGEVAVPGAQPLQLADHLPVELAVVAHLDPGQPLGVLGDQVGELVHERGALEARHRAPLAVEGGAGGVDGVVDVVGTALGDRRPGGARVRVQRAERAPVGGVDERARDVVLEPLEPVRSGHESSLCRADHTGKPPHATRLGRGEIPRHPRRSAGGGLR